MILLSTIEEASTVSTLEWYAIILVKLAAVALLIGMNAFFVAAEFAIVKVRSTQLTSLIKEGDKRAMVANYIVHHINPFLNTTQVGITLASLGLGWIGEPVFATILEPVMNLFGATNPALLHSTAFVIGFSIITFLHIILGECTPKTVAIFAPLDCALFVARPLKYFYKIFYPVIWALNETSLWMLHKIGLATVDETEHQHSEEEIKLLLSAQNDTRTQSGNNFVLNAIDLKYRTVSDIMISRHDIDYLNQTDTIDDAIAQAETSQYSRYPVCVMDDLDKVVGFIHIKDLYRARHNAKTLEELQPKLKECVYVPETANIEKLLLRMMDRKTHLAIVVDEYGGCTGLVTFENILEQLVGQIQDEFDQEERLIQKVKDKEEWIIEGHLPVYRLEPIIQQSIQIKNVNTVSGLFIYYFPSFNYQQTSDHVFLGEWGLFVNEVNPRRIISLRLKKVNPLKDTENE